MDELLHQNLFVKLACIHQRFLKCSPVGSLGNTHRRTGTCWLYEHRIGKALLQGLYNGIHVLIQTACQHQLPGSLGHTGFVYHQLGKGLIHSNSGSGNMGTHIGDACHLQQALHGTVLAVFTVEHREDHINFLCRYTLCCEAQQTLATDRRDGSITVAFAVHPGTGRQHGVVLAAKENPLAFSGNAHREDVIFVMINVVQNGLGRAQGNSMLRADAAEKNTDI